MGALPDRLHGVVRPARLRRRRLCRRLAGRPPGPDQGHGPRRGALPRQRASGRAWLQPPGTSSSGGSSAVSASAPPRSSPRPTSPRSRRRRSAAGWARCSSWPSSPASSSPCSPTRSSPASPAGPAASSGSGCRPGAGCSSTGVIPALAYGLMSLQIPESPRYLVARGENDKARGVLSQVLKTGIDERMAEIRRTVALESRSSFNDLKHKAPGCCRSSGSVSPCRSSSSSSAST